MTKAYPLQWPKGTPRTKNRKKGPYKVPPKKAFDELEAELRRFGVENVVISSNIPLRSDGAPYSDGLDDTMKDPGVAIYFTRKKRQVGIGCDTFLRPWENCRALGLAIEGMRALDRNGVTQILDQMFEGHMALPSPDMVDTAADNSWWMILGVTHDASAKEINAAYKARARAAGGTSITLNAAKEAGLDAARTAS